MERSVAAQARPGEDGVQLGLLIGGRWLAAGDRPTLAVIDPATEELLGRLPLARPQDLDAALDAAEAAFRAWRSVPAAERARRLERGIELLRTRTDHVARVITRENGKPLEEARIEVHMACEMMKWNAEQGRRVYGRILPPNVRGMRQQVLKEPIGVVATT